MNIEALWRHRSLLTYLLYPVSVLFSGLASLRLAAYRSGLLTTWRAPVPVIIVGNLTAGGSGKTPVTIALVNALSDRGYQPAVISRGYGGDTLDRPMLLNSDVPITEYAAYPGDEPQLIQKETGVPVAVFPDRKQSIQQLLATYPKTNVIVADDGLQHYALARTVEIVVVDPVAGFGNGFRLPAGPLRESRDRLRSVDYVLSRKTAERPFSELPIIYFEQTVGACQPVFDSHGENQHAESLQLSALAGTKVHAVTGIANPDRFFKSIETFGVSTVHHVFSDHHRFTEKDFAFLEADTLPVIMTAKDAVKVSALNPAHKNRLWMLPLQTVLPVQLIDSLVASLETHLHS